MPRIWQRRRQTSSKATKETNDQHNNKTKYSFKTNSTLLQTSLDQIWNINSKNKKQEENNKENYRSQGRGRSYGKTYGDKKTHKRIHRCPSELPEHKRDSSRQKGRQEQGMHSIPAKQ